MSHGNSNQERTFGYLSTLESSEHGYFGGYLVISSLGRPLEFHCTAPIRPSRAQQILYGPTLEPYLLGEQICGVLLETAKLKPAVILTDCEAALYVRARAGIPIALVRRDDYAVGSNVIGAGGQSRAADDDVTAGTAVGHGRSPASEVSIGSHYLQLAPGYEGERVAVEEALEQLVQRVQLTEPFARIHDAIREAQRSSDRAAKDMTKQPDRRKTTPLTWSLDHGNLDLRSEGDGTGRPQVFSILSVRESDERPIAIGIGDAELNIEPAGVVTTPLESGRPRTIGCLFSQRGRRVQRQGGEWSLNGADSRADVDGNGIRHGAYDVTARRESFDVAHATAATA